MEQRGPALLTTHTCTHTSMNLSSYTFTRLQNTLCGPLCPWFKTTGFAPAAAQEEVGFVIPLHWEWMLSHVSFQKLSSAHQNENLNGTSEWTNEVTMTSGEHVTAEKPHALVEVGNLEMTNPFSAPPMSLPMRLLYNRPMVSAGRPASCLRWRRCNLTECLLPSSFLSSLFIILLLLIFWI